MGWCRWPPRAYVPRDEPGGVGAYAAAFDENGYDDLAFLAAEAELPRVVADVGMKPGHAHKFVDFIQARGGGVNSSSLIVEPKTVPGPADDALGQR